MHWNPRGCRERPSALDPQLLPEGGGVPWPWWWGLPLSLSAASGFVNLDVVSVASTPQSEVLNPRFSEYPPRWPAFHTAETAFIRLTRELAGSAQPGYPPLCLSSTLLTNTGLILLRLAENHDVEPGCVQERVGYWGCTLFLFLTFTQNEMSSFTHS